MSVGHVIVIAAAAVAACMDIVYGKIPNIWICMCFAAGLWYKLFLRGIAGMAEFLVGFTGTIFLLFLLFVFRVLGAGDIKILAVISGVMGFSFGIKCTILSFFAGGIFSAFSLIRRKNLQTRFSYFFSYIRQFITTGQITPYISDADSRIHFGLPVFISTILCALGRV